MNFLYVGDIMGQPGIDVVERLLPNLRKDYQLDLVIAQAENVTEGKGMSVVDMRRLQSIGVDFFSGGNHTPKRTELTPLLGDDNEPVIGPANMPGCPGPGYKYIQAAKGHVLVISLLGQTVGRLVESTSPLHVIDRILSEQSHVERVATIVNFHGDYSSEKVVIGYYLDGRVTAVIGDHWHIPTADARVLPKGTAHITDVGMCGILNSSLGVKTDVITKRWRDGIKSHNELETNGPLQFNAVLIKTNEQNVAQHVEQIRNIID